MSIIPNAQFVRTHEVHHNPLSSGFLTHVGSRSSSTSFRQRELEGNCCLVAEINATTPASNENGNEVHMKPSWG